MSALRLIKKAFLLATRSKKRFLMFTVAYACLIGWVAYAVDQAMPEIFRLLGPIFGPNSINMVVAIIASAGMSMLYANIIVNYRKLEIATLKCIGWKNANIRVLISGEIFAVTLIAFLIVVEGVIHVTSVWALGIVGANPAVVPEDITSNVVIIQFWPIAFTFAIILGVQIGGILIANHKILMVRPIQALQKM
jgi:predicted lysophospholipase L1 biosynthesis ABC-type transport system permease subunit